MVLASRCETLSLLSCLLATAPFATAPFAASPQLPPLRYRLLLETKLAAMTARDVARATRAHVSACSVATSTDAVVVVAIEDSDDFNGDATAATASTIADAVAADADAAATSAREDVEARQPHRQAADASLSEEQLRREVGRPSPFSSARLRCPPASLHRRPTPHTSPPASPPVGVQVARLRRRAMHAEGALHRVGQRVGAVEAACARLASSATRLQHGAATVRQAVVSLREVLPDGDAALAAALAATDLLVADTAAAAAEGASAMNDAFVAGQRAGEVAASAARGEMGGGGGGASNLGGGGDGGDDDGGGGGGGDGGGSGDGGGGGGGVSSDRRGGHSAAAATEEGGQSTWREASGRVGGSGDAYQIGDATRSALRWVTGGVRGSS